MKVLAWINLVIASFCELYTIAGLPDAYDTAARFGLLFAIVTFGAFIALPALVLFAKK